MCYLTTFTKAEIPSAPPQCAYLCYNKNLLITILEKVVIYIDKKMIYFFKNESVLCIVAAFAGASMVYVPPSLAYAGYIDFRVLALLFCLMAVVSALSQIGTFHVLSNHLLKIAKTERSLALVLILLCFFTAMFITNDVALITFVPLTISIFHAAEQKTRIFRDRDANSCG